MPNLPRQEGEVALDAPEGNAAWSWASSDGHHPHEPREGTRKLPLSQEIETDEIPPWGGIGICDELPPEGADPGSNRPGVRADLGHGGAARRGIGASDA